ncbi:hypothetical protein LCL89_09185 [Halobacillus yeomjeoni]|uniref:hypothetical protein n=1 Tax=Halobacillus yeomjeoni TaxID=311194 RepID=UPI001CD3994A|nr:hypothetical protein [Halobacillus yeomjeoni]MCA0984216.1 hypothetical protein [Halobacillus yeomjeoni]
MNFFLYNCFLHFIFQLTYFYANDHFRKPISDFSHSDLVRAVILLMAVLSYFKLTGDLFGRFKEVSTKLKVVITILAFVVSAFMVGFLLAVYFEG